MNSILIYSIVNNNIILPAFLIEEINTNKIKKAYVKYLFKMLKGDNKEEILKLNNTLKNNEIKKYALLPGNEIKELNYTEDEILEAIKGDKENATSNN